MEWFTHLLQFILHLDAHLLEFANEHGNWIYGLLFLIIFCETGLVVAPFLPGDSLLFVAGAVAGAGALDINVMVIVLIVAAVLGDSVNFSIGRWIGPRVFRFEDSWLFRRRYLEQASAFYQRHGGKTIVIARFVPIVRTYAPFVAGACSMDYRRFIGFNVIGGVLWIALLSYAGYFFGGLAVVKNNLTLVILGIIALSLMPAVVEYLRGRRAAG